MPTFVVGEQHLPVGVWKQVSRSYKPRVDVMVDDDYLLVPLADRIRVVPD